ncbi:unnamed protein product [Trichogramma brassicae]|uniref:Uncharacterized protein n=1 Tax=Trichogramma brassicae TaxID=86971 RepID=A0A6H5I010_9HYME|nr:unnamed protein product [Trichogramma brassicae]
MGLCNPPTDASRTSKTAQGAQGGSERRKLRTNSAKRTRRTRANEERGTTQGHRSYQDYKKRSTTSAQSTTSSSKEESSSSKAITADLGEEGPSSESIAPRVETEDPASSSIEERVETEESSSRTTTSRAGTGGSSSRVTTPNAGEASPTSRAMTSRAGARGSSVKPTTTGAIGGGSSSTRAPKAPRNVRASCLTASSKARAWDGSEGDEHPGCPHHRHDGSRCQAALGQGPLAPPPAGYSSSHNIIKANFTSSTRSQLSRAIKSNCVARYRSAWTRARFRERGGSRYTKVRLRCRETSVEEKFITVRHLCKIYDRFDVNYIDESGLGNQEKDISKQVEEEFITVRHLCKIYDRFDVNYTDKSNIYSETVRHLFKIYDRFDVNYTNEFGFMYFHETCTIQTVVCVPTSRLIPKKKKKNLFGILNTYSAYVNENSNSNSRNTYIRDAHDGFNGIMKRIPKFNGKPEKLPLFCEAVRAAARQMPLMQREIIHSLEAKLVDEAEEYVGLLISYTSISDLLEDLRDRFGNRSVAEALVLELGRTIQGATEPVRSYSSRIQILYNRALITYDMAPDINDIERRAAKIALNRNVLSCFLHGLREPIQNYTRLCIPSNLPDAIRKAIDVERETLLRAATGSNISAMGLLNIPLTAPLPSKIAQEHSTGSESADATSSPEKDARKEGKIQCQYCFKYNHVAADCRKLKHDLLFCNKLPFTGTRSGHLQTSRPGIGSNARE